MYPETGRTSYSRSGRRATFSLTLRRTRLVQVRRNIIVRGLSPQYRGQQDRTDSGSFSPPVVDRKMMQEHMKAQMSAVMVDQK